MNKLFLTVSCLWVLCVVSSVAVVVTTFESRKSIHTLEKLRREATNLQVMSGQFLLERSTWSDYSRIESIATQELQMVDPVQEQTVIVYRKHR